jgi:quinohemoprotein ethanol dehydrogenase
MVSCTSFLRRSAAFAVMVALVSGVALAAKPVDTARIAAAAAEPQNWLAHGGTYAEQRYSSLAQIDRSNVGRLSLAWYVDLDTTRGQEATPLVVDGTIYTTTAWSKVYAIDAATGRVKWQYDPQVPGDRAVFACCDAVNRGAAFYDGRVYVGTLDGRLIALDAATGRLEWSTLTVDLSRPYTITGAPRVARGKVFIGNGGAELGVRGYISAYDAKTGKLVWRFYAVPGDPSKPDGAASDEIMKTLAGPTWFGRDYWTYGGGGTVWDSIVYDPELNQLYFGTGNGSPWNRVIRSEDKGDNLFLSSIVAVDPDTGRYLWHYQTTPGESWDYTATQQIMLATLPLDGGERKVLLQAPKNGFFYVIDRTDGRLLSAEKFNGVNWAERVDVATGRPVENPEARYIDKPFLSTSGAAGARAWFPMAWSPRTSLVYMPVQQIPFLYTKDSSFQYRPGQWNLGVDMMGTRLPTDEAGRKAVRDSLQGWLAAWDPIAQKERWRVTYDRPWNGGVLATGGDLVFQGLNAGQFKAYDARDGRELWSFDATTGVLAGPVSYEIDGEQYILVMAGNGGGLPLTLPAFDGPQPRPPGRVLAFKLGGKATLPAPPPPSALPPPPREGWSAATVEQGRTLFAANCAACHGMETLSAGVLPDLRRSALLGARDAWKSVVIDGVYSARGMIGFAQRFDAAGAEAIRAYVAAEAERALAGTQSRAAQATP